MKLTSGILIAVVGAFALVVGLGTRTRRIDAELTCSGADSRVVVDLKRHALVLCEKDHAVAAFDVRLGAGGLGKTREGDRKTPVGTYLLGPPRPSERFMTFIPIGYPTVAQKRLGYTGSAVGVHGPPRWAWWLGSLVNAVDFSDGCVGLARDSEIRAIADWVNAASVRIIELR